MSSFRRELAKVHGETVALAQPSFGWRNPGQIGNYLGCGQLTNFFNLLKESDLTGLQDFINYFNFIFPYSYLDPQAKKAQNFNSNPISYSWSSRCPTFNSRLIWFLCFKKIHGDLWPFHLSWTYMIRQGMVTAQFQCCCLLLVWAAVAWMSTKGLETFYFKCLQKYLSYCCWHSPDSTRRNPTFTG